MLEIVLDGFVVQCAQVSDHEVNDTDVHGQLEQESDLVKLSDTDFVGKESEHGSEIEVLDSEHLGEDLLPGPFDIQMAFSDEVHSQGFSEEEETEDECPNSSEEEHSSDSTPVLVMRDLEAVCTQDNERDGVSHISDHQSEEHRKEYRDQDGRVNLLILGYRHELGRILELLHDCSIVELRRSVFEPRLSLLRLLELPAAGLLDLDVDSFDPRLDLRLDGVGLGLGNPRVDHEGILAVRDPYGDLSLLDLDGKLFV